MRTNMLSSPIVLQAQGLTKQFGAVLALDQVDIELRSHEVHALVGANGAGKSTLIKILTGAVNPDSGRLLLNGQTLIAGDIRRSIDARIACIYQDAQLVPALSVMDNIMLGRHPVNSVGVLDRKQQRSVVERLMLKNELQLDLDSLVEALSPVQQKEVEIAKALSMDAKVLLMDEPTASLSHSEVEKLFRSIQQLREQGVAILYISHVLDEIFTIADRVTVLRDGKIKLSVDIGEINKHELVETILGKDLASEAQTQASLPSPAKVALECTNLAKFGVFKEVSLKVHCGEIVCITGLVGSKRSELVRALFGAEPADSGAIAVFDKPVKMRHPLDAIRLGIGFVPEDRRKDGLFLNLSLSLNTVMAHLSDVSRFGFLVQALIHKVSQRQITDLSIVPPHMGMPPRTLSGGNQQKVLLGRWLSRDTRILILDEPTVGIDVGTKANIYMLLRRLAREGKAILVVSSDMEEVLTLADRVVVMAQGQITAMFNKEKMTQDNILRAASGEKAS
jgi:ABC-type sugar transport system ATPase subunit